MLSKNVCKQLRKTVTRRCLSSKTTSTPRRKIPITTLVWKLLLSTILAPWAEGHKGCTNGLCLSCILAMLGSCVEAHYNVHLMYHAYSTPQLKHMMLPGPVSCHLSVRGFKRYTYIQVRSVRLICHKMIARNSVTICD